MILQNFDTLQSALDAQIMTKIDALKLRLTWSNSTNVQF